MSAAPSSPEPAAADPRSTAAAAPPVTLRGPRLRLRPWRESDLAPFAAHNADPRVMEHYPRTLGRPESDALAARLRALLDAQGYGFWAVERTADQAFIGIVGLMIPSFEAPFTPCLDIGWRLGAEHWGHGYATEAATAALAHAFGPLGRDEVVSFTVPGNRRSTRVMERLGMQRDPAEDFDHPHLREDHPLRRHVLYRITRATFLRQRG